MSNMLNSAKICLNALRTQAVQCTMTRELSTTAALCVWSRKRFNWVPKRKRIKYPNFLEASRTDRKHRTDFERLMGRGFKKIPIHPKFPVSAKVTGPHNEGGSKEAARLTAIHDVHCPGFINHSGKFIKVKEMTPELVVPDLKGFELKPYVPYKMLKWSTTPRLTPVDLVLKVSDQEKKSLMLEARKKTVRGRLASFVLSQKDKK